MKKKDRRIRKSETAINQAFLKLLTQKEFKKITIDNITELADINHGTFYLHYKDKFDLLDKTIKGKLVELTQLIQNATKNDIKAIGQATFVIIFDYFEDNYLFYSTLFANQGLVFFRDQFKEVIFNQINQQVLTDLEQESLNKEFLTQFISSAIVGVVEWWLANKMPLTTKEMAENTFKLFKQNQVKDL